MARILTESQFPRPRTATLSFHSRARRLNGPPVPRFTFSTWHAMSGMLSIRSRHNVGETDAEVLAWHVESDGTVSKRYEVRGDETNLIVP